MKTRRSLFTPGVLSLGVAILGNVAALSVSPAKAQTTIMASTTRSTSTSSTTTTTTTPALVSIKGVVSGVPESVSFSGQAKLNANVVTDPDFGNPPIVVLSIDLGSIAGVGSSTGKKYVASGQETLNRRLTAADTVQLTFPFTPSDGSLMASRTGMASFKLSFDVNTLKLTGATAEIVSP
jgi:cytoskeletal protein RodZ